MTLFERSFWRWAWREYSDWDNAYGLARLFRWFQADWRRVAVLGSVETAVALTLWRFA